MKSEADVCQWRFWERCVRDEDDFALHVDCIHINPVKHGYVDRATDWRWSSIDRFVRQRFVTADWATDTADDRRFGE